MLPSIFSENLFDELFDEAFEKRFWGGRDPLYGKNARNLMKTDVAEGDDCYKVAIDLPGFRKEDLKVDLKNGYLTVTATKGLDKEQKNEDGRYIRRERYAGSCSRSFYVGDVRPDEVKCRYESGVLMLVLPKRDTRAIEQPNRIAIE